MMDSAKSNWFAVKVRTRAESLVHNLLKSKDVPCFSPTYEEQRRYSDRIKRVEAALFPGYLFCQIPPERKLSVLNTPNVEYVLGYGTVSTPLEAQEIEAIHRLTIQRQARPHPYLRAGERVRITHGALAKMEGVLVNCPDRGRLVVISIELLQNSVSVKVERDQVEPLSCKCPESVLLSGLHV